jgi:uncharacterized protein with PIN domain
MQIRDTVKAAFDEAKFNKLIDRVEATSANRIEAETMEELTQVVNLSSKRFGFTEKEGNSVLKHLIEGREMNQFGLANAVTRAAQDDVLTYDRATEFEAIGGQIIELPKSEWRQIAVATKKAA